MKNTLEIALGIIVLSISTIFVSHILRINSINTNNAKFKKVFNAKFNNIDGIKKGSEVKIAGQQVGKVSDLKLDENTFQVIVKVEIVDNISLPQDSIIAVTSSGLFGSKFLAIKPGVEDDYLKENDFFVNTQSSINLEDLIGKFATNYSSKSN